LRNWITAVGILLALLVCARRLAAAPAATESTGAGGVVPHAEGRFRSPFARPDAGPPVPVRVGLVLANLRDYAILDGSFEADFYLSYTSDTPMPALELAFTNGKADLAETLRDEPTFKLYHFIGTFFSVPDLRDFPFDTQQLTIEIEDNEIGVDRLLLTADQSHTHLDTGFEVAGWQTAFLRGRVVTHNFPDRFDHDDLYYQRYEFGIGLRRFGLSAVFTVYVPAIVIVMISLSGLWLPKSQLEVRSNATTPMLAAAVLFHFALMQELPATPYLTRADKLMMAVYAILALHMLLSWLWFAMAERHTERIFWFGKRVGVPLTFAILVAGMFV
jgi:hypothetical protein